MWGKFAKGLQRVFKKKTNQTNGNIVIIISRPQCHCTNAIRWDIMLNPIKKPKNDSPTSLVVIDVVVVIQFGKSAQIP